MISDLHNNTELSRYELDVDGHVAFVAYRRNGDVLTLVHTEVPEVLNGRGIGSRLAQAVLHAARVDRVRVIAQCPFIAAYIRKHPEFQDLLS